MADDLRARLKGLIGKTVTEEDMQDLAVAIADALDAAPPPEREADALRVLLTSHEMAYLNIHRPPVGGHSVWRYTDDDTYHSVLAPDAVTALELLRSYFGADYFPAGGNVVPDSGADPEPQRVIVDFAEVEHLPELDGRRWAEFPPEARRG